MLIRVKRDKPREIIVPNRPQDGTVVVEERQRDRAVVIEKRRQDGTVVVEERREDGTVIVEERRQDGTVLVEEGRRDGTVILRERRRDGTVLVEEGQRDGTVIVEERRRANSSTPRNTDDDRLADPYPERPKKKPKGFRKRLRDGIRSLAGRDLYEVTEESEWTVRTRSEHRDDSIRYESQQDSTNRATPVPATHSHPSLLGSASNEIAEPTSGEEPESHSDDVPARRDKRNTARGESLHLPLPSRTPSPTPLFVKVSPRHSLDSHSSAIVVAERSQDMEAKTNEVSNQPQELKMAGWRSDEIPERRVLQSVKDYATTSKNLHVVAQTLEEFSSATKIWRALSNRLLDMRDSFETAAFAFTRWQCKLHVHEEPHKPRIYLQALYGVYGWTQIEMAAHGVDHTTHAVVKATLAMVNNAFVAMPGKNKTADMGAVALNLRRSSTLARKVYHDTCPYMEALEEHLEDLHRSIGRLERLSRHYLEEEHAKSFKDPDLADSAWEKVHLATSMDAYALFNASDEVGHARIALHSPNQHKRDFVFFVSAEGGQLQDIVAHPVKFKVVNDSGRMHRTLHSAISATLRSPRDTNYMLPRESSTDGFALSIPKQGHREFVNLGASKSPEDRIGITCGIAEGAFRLLSTPWVDVEYLQYWNIEWSRGVWPAVTLNTKPMSHKTRNLHTLESSPFERLHKQIFNIGMLLVDVLLTSSLVLVFDDEEGAIQIFKYRIAADSETNAAGVAADVEAETNNILLGSMVFFCLSVLQEKHLIAASEIELQRRYYQEVVKTAEKLRELLAEDVP